MFLAQQLARSLASQTLLGCNGPSIHRPKDIQTMQARRRTRQLPHFEASSLALFAFVVLLNIPSARAKATFGPAPTIKSAPAASAPGKTTTTQVVTPPRPPASSPKR
jgi:hypothetical protein